MKAAPSGAGLARCGLARRFDPDLTGATAVGWSLQRMNDAAHRRVIEAVSKLWRWETVVEECLKRSIKSRPSTCRAWLDSPHCSHRQTLRLGANNEKTHETDRVEERPSSSSSNDGSRFGFRFRFEGLGRSHRRHALSSSTAARCPLHRE